MEDRKETYDVCIVGMGIGGLATALALQQEGLSVYITEKDHVLSDRKQGYGLTLTNSTTGPLAKLGLLEACIQSNCPSHSHFTFNNHGHILGYYGRSVTNLLNQSAISEVNAAAIANHRYEEQHLKDFGGSRGNLRVPRQELRQLMLQKLNSESLHWGHKFLRFEETTPEYVTSFFEVSNAATVGVSPAIVSINSRILIGADGIRSCVRQLRDEVVRKTGVSPLQYVGASVILGISEIDHPLLCNRGYYVIDGTQRLFTMPFLTPTGEADNSYSIEAQTKKRQIMWQLSFSDITESEGRELRGSGHHNIMLCALNRTKSWFPAVTELIESTLPGEIWATPLYDRNAMALLRGNEQLGFGAGRVTVLGDACHPMSMFKGQGANQALEDSVLLAAKLRQRLDEIKQRAQKRKRSINNEEEFEEKVGSLKDLTLESMSNLLRTFEREMIGRADKKVQASRAAAKVYHSSEVFKDPIGIHGVPDDKLEFVLDTLIKCNITADLGESLEDTMSQTIFNICRPH